VIRSALSKLRKGLSRTRESLVGAIRSLVTGRTLDESLLREIEARLIQGDVGVATARKLVQRLREDVEAGHLSRGEDALDHLKAQLREMWPEADRSLRLATSGPTVILVTGVNGSGKTTSIAKLAAMMQAEGKSVLLAACDTFRAGAVRQLEIWAERLNIDVVKGQQGGDPAAVAFDAAGAAIARGVDVLIVDTAGRLQTQDPLMRQLGKIGKVLGKKIDRAPHETLLVLDATSGQNALRQVEEFSRAVPVSGLFLTKLDGTAKGGVVIAVRQASDAPVKFVGVGETPDDIQPFDPDAFVEALFAEDE